MTDPPFDGQQAHRWFAIEFNNRSWDLVEAPARSPAEVEEMIHCAHAACLHWSQAGGPINRLRALVLLATAYVRAGLAAEALNYAELAAACSVPEEEITLFDRATLHGAAAAALDLSGRSATAREQYRQFTQTLAAMSDPDDRRVALGLYPPTSEQH